MIVLWIILVILAILLITAALIIFTGRIKLTVSYSDAEGFLLKASALFVTFFDTRKNQRKQKNRSSHKAYTKKNTKKRSRSQELQPQRNYSITDIIRIVKNILNEFFKNHARYLSVRAVKLNISVATSDAATTAILYGIVSQGTAYVLELLNNINNLKPIKKSAVNIYPDYTAEQSSADIKFIFSLPLKSAIAIFFNSDIIGLFSSVQKDQ